MSDPLLELIGTALELMNHTFAPPGDTASANLEFYHQFRKLWDRGIPVGMGLGHILLKPDGEFLVVERIAEKGIASDSLALIAFANERLESHPGEYRVRIAIKSRENRWQIANESVTSAGSSSVR